MNDIWFLCLWFFYCAALCICNFNTTYFIHLLTAYLNVFTTPSLAFCFEVNSNLYFSLLVYHLCTNHTASHFVLHFVLHFGSPLWCPFHPSRYHICKIFHHTIFIICSVPTLSILYCTIHVLPCLFHPFHPTLRSPRFISITTFHVDFFSFLLYPSILFILTVRCRTYPIDPLLQFTVISNHTATSTPPGPRSSHPIFFVVPIYPPRFCNPFHFITIHSLNFNVPIRRTTHCSPPHNTLSLTHTVARSISLRPTA